MIGSQRSYLNNVAGQLHVWHWQGTERRVATAYLPASSALRRTFFPYLCQRVGGASMECGFTRVWMFGCFGGSAHRGGVYRSDGPLLELMTQPVYLLGFHSGALVAIEMANRYPKQVSGLVLVDVPVFSGPEWKDISASLTEPPDYRQQEDPMNSLFQTMVVDRIGQGALRAGA